MATYEWVDVCYCLSASGRRALAAGAHRHIAMQFAAWSREACTSSRSLSPYHDAGGWGAGGCSLASAWSIRICHVRMMAREMIMFRSMLLATLNHAPWTGAHYK